MDLKKRLVIYCFCIVNLTPLSFSAPVGNTTDLPHEKRSLQLSVDPTASGKCKPDYIKWILLAILCAVIVIFSAIICCIRSGRCNRRKSEEQERILSNEELQNLLEISQAEFEQLQNERDICHQKWWYMSSKTDRSSQGLLGDFFEARSHREDVILDPCTAHPRLEVSQDGKCVRDTGNVLRVPDNEKRFDSHMFVLAKEGFVKGKYYWEVEVGQKKNWDLGVASESISRKGSITLSPQNGYWVIGLDGKKDYWARTYPWTRLKVSRKPTKIGMFLDISDKKLSFYDVNKKSKLYTFTNLHPGIFYPFFSMGSVTLELDSSPLKILNNSEEE